MLLAAAEGHLFGSGIRRLLLASSNDNLEAHAFYQRRGWRLTSVHLDAMDRVRSQKPGLPVLGLHGLPLRDVWDFEKLPRD
jgi:hypothetical protein